MLTMASDELSDWLERQRGRGIPARVTMALLLSHAVEIGLALGITKEEFLDLLRRHG